MKRLALALHSSTHMLVGVSASLLPQATTLTQIPIYLYVLPVLIHCLDLVTQLLALQLAEPVQLVTNVMTPLFYLKLAHQEHINQAQANLHVFLVQVEHTHCSWRKSVTKHLVVIN